MLINVLIEREEKLLVSKMRFVFDYDLRVVIGNIFCIVNKIVSVIFIIFFCG